MYFILINDRKRVNDFLLRQKGNFFLQSWEWGEFQEQTGQPTSYYGVEEEGEIRMLAAVAGKRLAGRWSYFYSPRGPVLAGLSEHKEKAAWQAFLAGFAKERAAKDGVFWRIEPAADGVWQAFKPQSTIDIQPSRTVMIPLDQDEDGILARMHQKTRYNIRLGLRKGVAVEKAKDDQFVRFIELLKETADRDNFRLHGPEYYETMFKVLGGEAKGLRVRLYLARHKGDVLAGALVAFFGGYATYLHGASSNYKRNLMAPYALHWMIMQQAKQAGFVYYDLYGINKKLWPGVTRFKIGFGGEEVVYPGAYDIVFKPVNYKLYKTLRFARRKLL